MIEKPNKSPYTAVESPHSLPFTARLFLEKSFLQLL